MANAIQPAKLRRMVEQKGADEASRFLNRLIETREIKPHEINLPDLYEGFCGYEALRALDYRRKSARRLTEAADAVSTAGFTNTIGQLLVTKTKDAYETATPVANELAENMPSTFLHGERVPGIGSLGDVAEVVGEAEKFPEMGLSEEYIDFGPIKKRGFIVSVTAEAIIMDRTGQLLQRAADGGRFMGLNKEKRVLDVATGAVNTYKRNGVATNTYLTSGAYINKQVNPLATYRSVETAELLFDGVLDPTTGEPIVVNGPMTLLVPRALAKTAEIVVGASQIRIGDGASSGVATYAPNPVGGRPYKIVTNPYVSLRSGSTSKWHFGDFKGAFVYREAWAMSTQQQADTSNASFERQIVSRYRFDESGEAGVMEPRRVNENTAS